MCRASQRQHPRRVLKPHDGDFTAAFASNARAEYQRFQYHVKLHQILDWGTLNEHLRNTKDCPSVPHPLNLRMLDITVIAPQSSVDFGAATQCRSLAS